MNIVTEIRTLWATIRTMKLTAGRGITVEQTPNGLRVGLQEQVGGDGGFPWHGMFELTDTPGVPEDGDDSAVKVLNGADPESLIAGIAHVNRQPFEVSVYRLVVPRADPRTYIYMQFVAPVEETDDTSALPAQVSIVTSQGLRFSNATEVYHLIGQAWYDDDDSLVLEQDHLPGNVYIEWYGPCLGLLEEA